MISPRLTISSGTLYCIHGSPAKHWNSHRQITFFAAVTEEDPERERKVEVKGQRESRPSWQENGWKPDMAIDPVTRPTSLFDRGWMWRHQLFNARHLLLFAIHAKQKAKGIPTICLISPLPSIIEAIIALGPADRAREGVKGCIQTTSL